MCNLHVSESLQPGPPAVPCRNSPRPPILMTGEMKNPALYLCKGSPPGSASSDHQRALQPGPAPSHQSLASGQPRAGGLWVTSCPAQGLGGDFAFQAGACFRAGFPGFTWMSGQNAHSQSHPTGSQSWSDWTLPGDLKILMPGPPSEITKLLDLCHLGIEFQCTVKG